MEHGEYHAMKEAWEDGTQPNEDVMYYEQQTPVSNKVAHYV
jgi:hypothetical protein